MVYEKELTEWCRPDVYFVQNAGTQPLPIDSVMRKVAATLPDSVQITGVTLSPDAHRTWQVSLSQPRRASVYVDPYTGRITGRNERLPFFDTMFHLHRWLLGSAQTADGGPSVGKLAVGIGTLVLVIVLVTGILMWLTNRHKPLRKSLTISVTKGWPRFWHDLHVAGGIYATLFLLLLSLTGLTWSFSWYRTGFYAMFGVEASEGARGGGVHGAHREAAPEQERQHRHHHGEEGEYRAHHGRGGHGHGHRHHQDYDVAMEYDVDPFAYQEEEPQPFAHWQEVYDQVAKQYPDHRQITVSDGSAAVVPAGRHSLRATDNIDFDPATGQLAEWKPYVAQDKGTRMRGTVYTLHTGSWGCTLTRILTLLSALLGATLPLTGYYLWIRRLLNKSSHRHGE